MGRQIGLSVCLLVLVLLQNCSMQKMAIRSMVQIVENGMPVFYEEGDLDLAEKALAANLKLLESLSRGDPQNRNLLLMLAQGYAGYALCFLEDEAPERAVRLYLRARNFAWRVLQMEHGWPEPGQLTPGRLDSLLKKIGPGERDKAALFWSGFSWAAAVQLSLSDPQAYIDLALICSMMKRMLQLDSTYFYGAPLLFWGSYYGQLPPALGGNPQKAREFFRKCIDWNQGNFLLAYVYAARFYAARVLDEELFDQYLQTVLQAPLEDFPQIRLLNQVAKQRAHRLLQQKNEFF